MRVAICNSNADVVVRVVLSRKPRQSRQAGAGQRERTEYEFSSFSLDPMASMLGE